MVNRQWWEAIGAEMEREAQVEKLIAERVAQAAHRQPRGQGRVAQAAQASPAGPLQAPRDRAVLEVRASRAGPQQVRRGQAVRAEQHATEVAAVDRPRANKHGRTGEKRQTQRGRFWGPGGCLVREAATQLAGIGLSSGHGWPPALESPP